MYVHSRSQYTERLNRLRGTHFVKVVTGLRRSGKSTLLRRLFREQLLSSGVCDDHIISLTLDKYDEHSEPYLRDPGALLAHIRQQKSDGGQYYALLDEIQNVPDFELLLNTLLEEPGLDVYVTGSNSRLLASDINTIFRGRGLQVHVWPFTFAEFCEGRKENESALFDEYIRYGGMPALGETDDPIEKERYLKELWQATYINDVVERYKLRNRNALSAIANALCSNIGALTNPLNVTKILAAKMAVKLNHETVTKYLNYLQEAYLFTSAQRYDVRGGGFYNNSYKLYATDIGLRNARLEFRQREPGKVYENLVYNELLYRGYTVHVGSLAVRETDEEHVKRYKTLEVDFVANKSDRRVYLQVTAASEANEDVMQRELDILRRIDDDFEKVLIAAGPFDSYRDNRGVFHLAIIDFLLDRGTIHM